MKCSRCNKNMAVVFITKMEDGRQKNIGYCLSCAKKLGLKPLDQFMGQLGINEEELDELNNQVGEFFQIDEDSDDIEDDSEIDGYENPFNFINKIFNKNPLSQMQDRKPNRDLEKKQDSNSKTKTIKKEKRKSKKFLNNYGINLTDKAKKGEIDKVIGRQQEIDRIIQILNRRTKNNPVILGEAGVGKTAIAEGLAVRIVNKEVPAKLLDFEVYLLDFTSIVAGTQFRGQFESRLKGIIKEVKELANIILVIDELHNIVGAGDAEGAMSAANILKPALAKGELQVIGATTLTEYRKFIEKDTALERRFQTIIIEEPSIDESIEILKGIKGYYEEYHKVKITDEVIKQAVLLSKRYITERFLPDKAIDVIDEAGSKANLKNKHLLELAKLNEELQLVQLEKEDAISEDSTQNYQKAAELKMKECQITTRIKELEEKSQEIYLTVDDIAAVIELWTDIPVQKINQLESERLINIEERIHKKLIGQEKAVSVVAKAIRRNRAGLQAKKRPISFIFVGPTGVGKTELVKVLSEELFDDKQALIRVDMSEYMEKHTVSKIIGAPPGYVGYDDAGHLTEQVRRRPYSVILLDEIEKAHPDVFNILLQILDDGRVTDSQGKLINFENTIIIMTSNAGSNLKLTSYGFVANEDSKDSNLRNKTKDVLRDIFRPEFLNRIDEIVVFNKLKKDELIKIVNLMVSDLINILKEKGIALEVTDKVKEYILKKGYDDKYGARPLRRTIQRELEDKLADMLIRNEFMAGDNITAHLIDDSIDIKVNK